jgi:hypothetical protein
METKSAGIRKSRPSQADLQALRDATDKLEAVMSLTDDEIESAVRDFDALRKGAAVPMLRVEPSDSLFGALKGRVLAQDDLIAPVEAAWDTLKETHPPAPETAAPAASPPPC